MLEEEKEIIVPRNRSLYLASSVDYLHLSRIFITIKYMVMCFKCSNATSHTPTTPVITSFTPLNESHSITMAITFLAFYSTRHS